MKKQGKAIRCDNKAKQRGVTTKQHNKAWNKVYQWSKIVWWNDKHIKQQMGVVAR
jgi:hypothetical protein